MVDDIHDTGWYCLANDIKLEQGDCFSDFPVPIPQVNSFKASKEKSIEVIFVYKEHDVIVMTQSCDLVDIEDDYPILLCPRSNFLTYIEDNNRKSVTDDWSKLQRGYIIDAHLLNKCEIEKHEFDYQVVNLLYTFTLPYRFVRSLMEEQTPHIRLLSPYKEHLAQAFARRFMRVGLPLNIPRKCPYMD